MCSALYISSWSAKWGGESGVAVASAPCGSSGLLNRLGRLPAPSATRSAVVTLPLDPGGRMLSVAPSASYGLCSAEAVVAATAGPTASEDKATRTSRRRMGKVLPEGSGRSALLRHDRAAVLPRRRPSPPSDPARTRRPPRPSAVARPTDRRRVPTADRR